MLERLLEQCDAVTIVLCGMPSVKTFLPAVVDGGRPCRSVVSVSGRAAGNVRRRLPKAQHGAPHPGWTAARPADDKQRSGRAT